MQVSFSEGKDRVSFGLTVYACLCVRACQCLTLWMSVSVGVVCVSVGEYVCIYV